MSSHSKMLAVTQQDSIERLNSECFCISLDTAALRQVLESEIGQPGLFDGSVWTTGKDGIAALLSAEITARTSRDPGARYSELCTEFGKFFADRIDALAKLTLKQVVQTELAGEAMTSVIVNASGNHAPIGGIKVSAESGWFAARPSGTEDIYKIYAESFRDDAHLHHLLAEAQCIVDAEIEPKESS